MDDHVGRRDSSDPTALDLAVAALGDGGQVLLAKRCGVTPQAVNQWVRKGKVPPERVIDVEAATGISRHELRPDIFGPPPTQTNQVTSSGRQV